MSLAFVLATTGLIFAQAEDRRRATLDFPAIGTTASESSRWFYGGHTAERFDLQHPHFVGDEHAGDASKIFGFGSPALQRVELPDTVITQLTHPNPTALVIAGTYESAAGMLGSYDVSTRSFAWRHNDLPHPITSMTATDNLVIVGDDAGEVRAFGAANGAPQWVRNSHAKMVTSVVNISDVMGASGDWTGKIELWNPKDGAPISSFQQHRDRIVGLVKMIGEDSTTSTIASMASASRDGTVRLWYPAQRRLVRFVQLEKPITAITGLSSSRVVVATNDAVLHLIDLTHAKVVSSTQCTIDFVTHIFQVDDSLLMALQGNGEVELVRVVQPVATNE